MDNKNIEKTDDLDEKQYSQERIDNHFSPNIERPFNFDVQTTDLAQKNQFQESISFDKKYQNKDFGEYRIRPLRKNNIENKVSNFTLINKLNFFNSLTLNVLFLVAVSLIYSFNRDMFNSNIVQLAILIGCAVIFQCCFVYQLLRYLGNKDKKTIFKFEKEKFFNSLFIGIIAMLVVVSVNILFGLKLTNITEYLGSLVIPIILFCGLILSPITKIILNKFNIFNK